MTENGTTTTYTYDANNRLLTETKPGSVKSYTYDANGNMLSGDGATYTYDARDRQSSYVKGSAFAGYTYYPTGLRKTKTSNLAVTNYAWYGGNMVLDYTGSAAAGKLYVYGLTLISQGNPWYYIYNAHGDVIKYINSSGAVLKSYDYDAFGEEVDPNAADANPFRYAGQYFDSETGTYYLRARYYSPALGRFTQQDAWGYGNPGDPLSLNLYVYCYGNPVRYFDPNGTSAKDVMVGIGLALDDSLSDGTAQWIVHLLTDSNHDYAYESEYDYYLGRVIGDILAVAIGTGESIAGILKIVKAISAGTAITVGSGGVAAVGGVAIAVGSVTVGAVELSYGATVIVLAASNLGDDWNNLQSARKQEYKKPTTGSAKEKAKDVPSWAKGNAPYVNESGSDFAKRLCDEHFGEGNYQTGPGSDYNKIKKWGDRGFK